MIVKLMRSKAFSKRSVVGLAMPFLGLFPSKPNSFSWFWVSFWRFHECYPHPYPPTHPALAKIVSVLCLLNKVRSFWCIFLRFSPLCSAQSRAYYLARLDFYYYALIVHARQEMFVIYWFFGDLVWRVSPSKDRVCQK